VLDVRDEDDVSPVPSVGNTSPAASLHPTCDLGRSNPRSTRDWICSSVTDDVSHTGLGSGSVGFSIFAYSNPTLLNLKVTSDFTRMRGHGGGGSKLGGALASRSTARRQQP
jgi:hypothetical protein